LVFRQLKTILMIKDSVANLCEEEEEEDFPPDLVSGGGR
jgi:hypothetical protein